MINKSTLDFLNDLKRNNNRDWFAENKTRYNAARTDVEKVVAELLKAVNEFDTSIGFAEPKKLMFRIYRDTRFSQNKDPYKTNMGAVLCAEEDKKTWCHADYYVHIEPDNCFVSCGMYMPDSKFVKAIRTAIYENFDTFLDILNNPQFKKLFGELVRDEDTLQRVPNGFDKTHPSAEYLKLKHFYVFSPITDKEICSNTFVEHAANILEVSKPLKDFLNKAVEDL